MIKLEKTISLGNLITLGAMMIAATGSYYTLDAKAQQGLDIARIAAIKSDETSKKSIEIEKSIVKLEIIASNTDITVQRIYKIIEKLEEKAR
jgi:tRNA A37 threonylcarbamoyladenosine synthetase subunit TsaC/SUA5/YrdC